MCIQDYDILFFLFGNVFLGMQKISLLGGPRTPQIVKLYIKGLFINDYWLITGSQKNISSDGQCVNTLASST